MERDVDNKVRTDRRLEKYLGHVKRQERGDRSNV